MNATINEIHVGDPNKNKIRYITPNTIDSTTPNIAILIQNSTCSGIFAIVITHILFCNDLTNTYPTPMATPKPTNAETTSETAKVLIRKNVIPIANIKQTTVNNNGNKCFFIFFL